MAALFWSCRRKKAWMKTFKWITIRRVKTQIGSEQHHLKENEIYVVCFDKKTPTFTTTWLESIQYRNYPSRTKTYSGFLFVCNLVITFEHCIVRYSWKIDINTIGREFVFLVCLFVDIDSVIKKTKIIEWIRRCAQIQTFDN